MNRDGVRVCPEMEPALADLLAGIESDASDAARRHAGDCPACGTFVEESRGILDEVRSVPPADPGEAYRRGLPGRVEARDRTRRRRGVLAGVAGLAAALLLGAVLVPFALRESAEADRPATASADPGADGTATEPAETPRRADSMAEDVEDGTRTALYDLMLDDPDGGVEAVLDELSVEEASALIEVLEREISEQT